MSNTISTPSIATDQPSFSLSSWLEESTGINTAKKYYATEMENNGRDGCYTLASLDFAGDVATSFAGGLLGFAGSAVGTVGFIPTALGEIPYQVYHGKSWTDSLHQTTFYGDASGLVQGVGNFFGSMLMPVFALGVAGFEKYEGDNRSYGEILWDDEKGTLSFAGQSIAGYDSFNPNKGDAIATSAGTLGALFVGGKAVKGMTDIVTFDYLPASALQQAFSEAMNPGGKEVVLPTVSLSSPPVPNYQIQPSNSGLQVELAEGGDIVQTALKVLKDFKNRTSQNNRIVLNTQGWSAAPLITDRLTVALQTLAERNGVTICLKSSSAPFATEFEPAAEVARQQAAGPMAAVGSGEQDRVLVLAGTYPIGTDIIWMNNPLRQVTLTQPFEIARYPITHGDRATFYQELAGRNEIYALMATLESGRRVTLAIGDEAALARVKVPSYLQTKVVRIVPDPDVLLKKIPENQRGARQPAVSWLYDELVAYANAHGGRLPTAAEWEVAARTAEGDERLVDHSTANGLLWNGAEKMADFGGSAPREVGSYSPNPRGIYDMTGGVWEYTDTFWGEVDVNETVDPTGPRTGDYRSVRGGSSFYSLENGDGLHAADGNGDDFYPAKRGVVIGGRPVWRPQDSK